MQEQSKIAPSSTIRGDLRKVALYQMHSSEDETTEQVRWNYNRKLERKFKFLVCSFFLLMKCCFSLSS